VTTTPTISAYIIAYNEVDKIEAAINSVMWADEIILADSHSTDGTIELAEKLGAKVVQIDFAGFGKLRNEAIKSCTCEWIFSLDSDERCTPDARDAIFAVINNQNSEDIWKVPRRNWFMNKWIKHSGWYPNFRQPQLFRNGKMTYDNLPVHEGWIPASGATINVLQAAIWQIPFWDLSELQHKSNRYSTLGSEKVLLKGGGNSMFGAFARSYIEFFKHFFLKLGILDGWAGYVIARGAAEGAFFKHAKAYDSKNKSEIPPSPPLHREKLND